VTPSRVSRRTLLSTAAALPALSELVVPTAPKVQASAEVLPFVERRAGEAGDHRVCARDDDAIRKALVAKPTECGWDWAKLTGGS